MIQIIGGSDTIPQFDPEILNITDKSELNYWLSKFVVEVRNKKKIEIEEVFTHPPYQLYCRPQRHLRHSGHPEVNVFTDTLFKHFQDCLDTEMKFMTELGVGSGVKEARALSEDRENSSGFSEIHHGG